MIAPAFALAHVRPDIFEGLSDAEALVAAFDLEMWLRPDQQIPRTPFQMFGFTGGRGMGKSLAISFEINRRVEAGEVRTIALMAPTLDRVKEVQVDFLVATSPPWFRAVEHEKGVRWPNGVEARPLTPEAPGRPRSGNYGLSWLCEIVDWQATTRWDAFQNISTATRTGKAQLIWDTTSKGKNEVIQYLVSEHKRDPIKNIIRKGTTFDNPLLTKDYLIRVVQQYVKGSRRYCEEILGQIFAESAGALWKQEWLDSRRVEFAPRDLEIEIVSIDPSQSDKADADEAGCTVLGRDKYGAIYVLEDLSGRQAPEAWATAAVDRCEHGAAGVVYERNNAGDMPRDLIKVIAAKRGIRISVLADDKVPFPRHTKGVIHIRVVTSRQDKGARAEAPAALYGQGGVHHVGTHAALELEMTTWEPDGRKSPNRLDACAQGVAELAGIRSASKKDARAAVAAAQQAQKMVGGLFVGGGRRLGF